MSGVFARFERGLCDSVRLEKEPKLRVVWSEVISSVGSGFGLVSGGFGAVSDCRLCEGRRGDLGGRGGDGSAGVMEDVDEASILDLGVSEKFGGGPAMPTRRERGSLGEVEGESVIEAIWICSRGGMMGGLSNWCQKEVEVWAFPPQWIQPYFVPPPTGCLRQRRVMMNVRKEYERIEWTSPPTFLRLQIALTRFSIHVKAVRPGTTVSHTLL